MTPEHIRTVQSTCVEVLPIKDTAAQVFCERLFETDPSLRGLFRGDMRQQGAKLMQVIDAAVNGLSRLERTMREAAVTTRVRNTLPARQPNRRDAA